MLGALLGVGTSVVASSGGSGAGAAIGVIVYLALAVLTIAGLWKMFEKAGQQGWMAIIPILNIYIMVKIAGKEGWWVILFFIPCVNIVVSFIVHIALAEKYGKGVGYGVGMTLLPVIFYPLLGFGDAQYQGDTTRII